MFKPVVSKGEIAILVNKQDDTVTVYDSFGEFMPFPMPMWRHYVEAPYQNVFIQKGKTYRWVVDQLLRDFKHRYICNN